MINEAKKIVNSGMYFIPLLPNEKKNWDTDHLTRDYTEKDLIPGGNLAINPKKSKIYVVDLDSELAIKFGNLWLPNNTTMGARQYPDKKIEKTHWYFKSDGSLTENTKSLPAELYCDHNIVAFGTTMHKKLNVPMKRFWASEESPCEFNESILATFNKINFAAELGKYLNQTNQGGLRLDSCLWRYCKDWTDDDRINFLTDFFNVVRPGSKHNSKKAWERK